MDIVTLATGTLATLPGFWTSPITSFIIMLAGFGLVVFIHELGHFAVAKWVGIHVQEFALGFGRRLISFRRGETEYRLNILPLGGYVKMLGQDDFKPKEGEEVDPRAFNNRPIWARIAVVSAGVVMNIILAGLLFMIVFSVGISFPPARIGGVEPGYMSDLVQLPDALGTGIKPGDLILSIKGKPIHKFSELGIAATLSDKGEQFPMRVLRPGVEEPFDVVLMPETIKKDGRPDYQFGLKSSLDNVLDDSSDTQKYLKRVFGEALCGGDKVLAVGGKSIQHPWDLEAILENVGPGAVPIEVKRGGKPATAKVRGSLSWSRAATHLFRLEGKQGHWLFWDANDSNERKDKDTDWFRQPSFNVLGLRPRMQVHDVEPDSPAEEIGLKLGDIITSYTDVKGKLGEVVPSWETFHKINNENRGQVLPIRILRDGNEISLKIKVKKNEDEARVGIASQADDAHLVIADVLPGSPFFGTDDGKALAGSTVTAVNGQTVTTWADLIAALSPLKSDDTVTLFYTTPMGGKGQKTTPIAMEKFGYDSRLPIADYYAWPLLTLPMAPLEGPKMYAPPLAALRQGVHETGDFIVLTYATLKQFIKGRVHGAQFSGPVGIFRMGLQVGEHRGPIWVVWLLAVISANLAVINFLPLPIVDGGHVVFLIIEKIRRRPLSVAVQNAVQIAGLVAIGLAFVLLTYNDIRQWLSSQWH